jgi:hypothetical protein
MLENLPDFLLYLAPFFPLYVFRQILRWAPNFEIFGFGGNVFDRNIYVTGFDIYYSDNMSWVPAV